MAASLARSRGARWLRLDCAAENDRLTALYTGAGFTGLDIVTLDWFTARRFERRLDDEVSLAGTVPAGDG